MFVHNLGYPRIGGDREMKFALERYWRGRSTRGSLNDELRELRVSRWRAQADWGVDLIPVGDFPLYDQVLETSIMLGLIPERFRSLADQLDRTDLTFAIARGYHAGDHDLEPSPMTKWFNTNYHYIRPEIDAGDRPAPDTGALLEEISAAHELGFRPKPVLVGPLTYLHLAGHTPDSAPALTAALATAYAHVLADLDARVDWVQIDEPILVLDLSNAWLEAFRSVYETIAERTPKDASNEGTGRRARVLLATYFGDVSEHAELLQRLPVDGIHVDVTATARGAAAARSVAAAGHAAATRKDGAAAAGRGAARANEGAAAGLAALAAALRSDQILSVGIVNGRNVWRNDLEASLGVLEPLHEVLGNRLWLAPSCSLLHVPLDASRETSLDPTLRAALAFADQKLEELAILRRALAEGRDAVANSIADARSALQARSGDPRTAVDRVRSRVAGITRDMARRAPYPERRRLHERRFALPILPTTTIGSFPQTAELRKTRRSWRRGELTTEAYEAALRAEIAETVRKQEEIGLDVIVHGEAERTDMVEYFGEQLAGFAFTERGWVQSYGSRCVKPPVIHGDVERSEPMTVRWSAYAQSLTDRPVKGMLTGPITILQWSFPREDLSRRETALQIALALRDEVHDLETAGIGVIQVDEPALREGLPLRAAARPDYLEWATLAFRLATSDVENETQIHTHMCYSDFNDIIESIVEMDADVITIEATRARMRLLEAFETYSYPNEIGPGVYDIHSPLVPGSEQIVDLLRAALRYIPGERLWINPDCGLKTRGWEETVPSLRNMVAAARELRNELAHPGRRDSASRTPRLDRAPSR
ncbi:MAG: 5-methyltetrahydropteroyltriglutamate--homocysteine S-methyltransferase [Spirochaetota bacterium]